MSKLIGFSFYQKVRKDDLRKKIQKTFNDEEPSKRQDFGDDRVNFKAPEKYETDEVVLNRYVINVTSNGLLNKQCNLGERSKFHTGRTRSPTTTTSGSSLKRRGQTGTRGHRRSIGSTAGDSGRGWSRSGSRTSTPSSTRWRIKSRPETTELPLKVGLTMWKRRRIGDLGHVP